MKIHQSNTLHKQTERKKTHSIISDSEKAFDKIQHPFMWKDFREIRNTKHIPKHNKSNTHQANIKLNWAWSNPTKIRNKRRLPTLFLCIQYSICELLARPIRQLKEIKGIQIGNEEVKVLLFVDYLIVWINDSKYSTRELLQLMNTFSKMAGYKIISQKISNLPLYKC